MASFLLFLSNFYNNFYLWHFLRLPCFEIAYFLKFLSAPSRVLVRDMKKSSSPFFITSQSNVEPEIQILKVIYKTHLSELQWAALPESNTACSSTSGQEFLSLPPPTAQCMATLYFAYWKTVGNQLAAVVMKVKLTSFYYSVLSFGYALPPLTYLISEPVCLTNYHTGRQQ